MLAERSFLQFLSQVPVVVLGLGAQPTAVLHVPVCHSQEKRKPHKTLKLKSI